MAIKICKACKTKFDTRYQDLYCNACKPLKNEIKPPKEKILKQCETCKEDYLGWYQAKYCSNQCKPVYVNRFNQPSNRPRSTKNLKNTLHKDCEHFFKRNQHKLTEETMIFTCNECKGKMEIFKKPYNQD